jgi:regulator of sirC expression with transglutaminase-like and TPR domain
MMRAAEASELPFLLKLLDDESPAVRPVVIDRLAALGGSLAAELTRLAEPPGQDTRRLLGELLAGHHRGWLREVWPGWLDSDTDAGKLEKALALLAEFQGGRLDPRGLPEYLDDLVLEFRRSRRKRDPARLAEFLFETYGLAGAKEDYHHPDHSNLVHVITEKRGIPISLTLTYMLVGGRLGLDIRGCSFPGHFLARVVQGGETLFVDCFHGGRFLRREDILEVQGEASRPLARVLDVVPSPEAILLRVLNNLVRAYTAVGRLDDAALMKELAQGMQATLAHRRSPRKLPAGPAAGPRSE